MPQPLRILIADDESPARRKLREYLDEEADIGEIAEAANGVEAQQLIASFQPNLVLLDIQMPGKTGFEVIETVGVEAMPAVIFVTAYDQYAIEAFEVQALDYLLKPFDRERFRKALARARQRLQARENNPEVLTQLLKTMRQPQAYPGRIMVNQDGRLFFVKTVEIRYIAAAEKYVQLHAKSGKYLLRETMNHLEERLDPSQFVRIHRSHIVNIDRIREMHPGSHGDYVAILQDGEELIVSRRYRDRLFSRGDR